jgi:hypothetical protein
MGWYEDLITLLGTIKHLENMSSALRKLYDRVYKRSDSPEEYTWAMAFLVPAIESFRDASLCLERIRQSRIEETWPLRRVGAVRRVTQAVRRLTTAITDGGALLHQVIDLIEERYDVELSDLRARIPRQPTPAS